MNDYSLPQLLLWQFPLGPWSNIFIVYPWKLSQGYIIGCKPSQILQKSHINCWLKECEQTFTARHRGWTFNKKTLLFCLHVKLLEGKCGEKNIWHERLLVNNLQGHTEHVRPTKTTQLQALRLPLCARAWSNPCFVLIGPCYKHQGETSSQDTHCASLKYINPLEKSVFLDEGMER